MGIADLSTADFSPISDGDLDISQQTLTLAVGMSGVTITLPDMQKGKYYTLEVAAPSVVYDICDMQQSGIGLQIDRDASPDSEDEYTAKGIAVGEVQHYTFLCTENDTQYLHIGGYLVAADEIAATVTITFSSLQLTAPTNVATVSIPYSYRYGFCVKQGEERAISFAIPGYSGKRQEREQQLNQSVTSAEYWFYDGRLGRRWNVDPVVKYWESGYACFFNNPIIYNDPIGRNGELVIDDKNKTVTLNANLHLYGSKATPEFAQKVQDQINNDINKGGINGTGLTYKVGNEKYKFISNVTVDVISEDEALKQTGYKKDANGKITFVGNANTDIKNNYIRVEDFGTMPSQMSNNNGLFNVTRDFVSSYTTATHEFFHSLGLYNTNGNVYSHSYDDIVKVSPPIDGKSQAAILLDGRPDMMVALGTLVPAQYGTGKTYNYKGKKYKLLDTGTRMVTANNINDIVRNKIFEAINGIKTMKLGGSITNRLYKKNGENLNIVD